MINFDSTKLWYIGYLYPIVCINNCVLVHRLYVYPIVCINNYSLSVALSCYSGCPLTGMVVPGWQKVKGLAGCLIMLWHHSIIDCVYNTDRHVSRGRTGCIYSAGFSARKPELVLSPNRQLVQLQSVYLLIQGKFNQVLYIVL